MFILKICQFNGYNISTGELFLVKAIYFQAHNYRYDDDDDEL